MRRMGTSRTALRAAALSLAGLILTGILALTWPAGRGFDAATLHGFLSLDRPLLDPLLLLIIQVGNPVIYAFLGGLIVLAARRRQQPRLAMAIVAILFASVATAEVLKVALTGIRPGDWISPDWSIGASSWPSGHAAAAMSLSMCAIMASPPARRHLVAAAGAALTIAVSYALVAAGGHLPSDVVGAFFVSSFWTALALAVLRRHQEGLAPTSWRTFLRSSLPAYVVPWGLAATLVLAVVVARPERVAGWVPGHEKFLVGALLIAMIAQAVVIGFARLLGPERRGRETRLADR
jgi:membrane-associated phospholipid phosphatase